MERRLRDSDGRRPSVPRYGVTAMLLCALAATGPGVALAQRPDPAPRTYHPRHEPRADTSNSCYDPDYDAKSDPNHPLKNPKADPGPGWEQNKRYDGTPPVASGEGDWPWGEMFYGQTFQTTLKLTNNCEAPQQASIFVTSAYLTFPPVVVVPGEGQAEVVGTITMPPQPDPPIRVGLPGEPGWGWVNPVPFDGWTPATPEEAEMVANFHQPNFANVDELAVVIWHPWTDLCAPKRVTYHATGHIHFPPPPGDDSGPSTLATSTPCEIWWRTGEVPGQLTLGLSPAGAPVTGGATDSARRGTAPARESEAPATEDRPDPGAAETRRRMDAPAPEAPAARAGREAAAPSPSPLERTRDGAGGPPPADAVDPCTASMRQLATDYLVRVVQPYVLDAPDDWAWLPSFPEIGQMSTADLLAMKSRADAQIAAIIGR